MTQRNAIILAAGRGERLRPVTDDIPKPLIKVNGVVIIDTILNALEKNGITDIYVVIGYHKEKFEAWASLHSNIKLITNPYFETTNNISSLYSDIM